MCEFSSLLVRTFSITRLSVTFMHFDFGKSSRISPKALVCIIGRQRKKENDYGNNCLLYCLKLVLFLVFSLLYFLCRGPFARSQLCLQLTRAWNKPSNSFFVFTFSNDYDWPHFDKSPTGLCQTRSGVKWVDTQKPWGFLPALLFLHPAHLPLFLQVPYYHYLLPTTTTTTTTLLLTTTTTTTTTTHYYYNYFFYYYHYLLLLTTTYYY